MPLKTETAFGKRFSEQLEQIRAKIESLPENQQARFHSLADQAEQHQHSMENDCAPSFVVPSPTCD